MQFLDDYSTFEVIIQGMSFIWKIHYGNPKNECPKLNLLCREILLERQDYKCVLTYYICKANIDLNKCRLIVMKFNNESIELTLLSSWIMGYFLN